MRRVINDPNNRFFILHTLYKDYRHRGKEKTYK
jgi:hypothetical protein